MAAGSDAHETDTPTRASAELELLRRRYLKRASGATAGGKVEKAWLASWAANTLLPAADGEGPAVPELPIEQIKNWPDGELLQLIAEAVPLATALHWRDFVANAIAKGEYLKAAVVLSRIEAISPAGEGVALLKARLFEARGLADVAILEYAKVYDGCPSDEVISRIASIVLQHGLGRGIVHAMVERVGSLKQHPVLEACATGPEIEGCIDILVDAAAKSPSEPWVWLALARAQRRNGQTDAGCASLEKSLAAATPDDTWILNAIADDFDALGQAARAAAALLKATAAHTRRTLSFNRFLARQVPSPAAPQPARLPLLLIGQIQRSGGTLISQLFDGHPQVLAHPDEIKIGRPQKWHWPDLDLDAPPETWLRDLIEEILGRFIHYGYAKAGGNEAAADAKPFNFDLSAFCRDFLGAVSTTRPRSQREILDAYFSAYFSAWADRKVDGRERWITGFAPSTTSNMGSTDRFLRDYPDGLLVHSVRNPFDWFISARERRVEYGNIHFAVELWKSSTLSALELYGRSPRHIHLMTYEALVADTPGEMRRLAQRMGIEMHPALTIPTLLGESVLPNSSFQVREPGIMKRTRDPREFLSSSEYEIIARDAMPLYRRFVEILEKTRD